MQTDNSTPVDMTLALSLYKQGYNCAELGRRFGISRATLRSRFVRLGVQIRYVSNKRFSCNTNFFSSIDTPLKAQALGLIYADGCIATTRTAKTFILALAEKDVEYLESFRQLIDFTGELKRQGGKDGKFPYHVVRIYDNTLYDNLIMCGVTERKSLTIPFPSATILPPLLIKAFILGYFEGDGSVSFNSSNKIACVSIVGSHLLIPVMRDYIATTLGIHVGIEGHRVSRGVSVLRIGGNRQVLKFLNWLYEGSDPTFRLARKHAKYQEFKTYMEVKAAKSAALPYNLAKTKCITRCLEPRGS